MKLNRNVSYLNQNKSKLNYVIKFSMIECSLFITHVQPATTDVFPVVANTRTKSVQKQVKSIDVNKVGSKKPLASKSCFIQNLYNHLLISRSNLQASKTECRCKSVVVKIKCTFFLLYQLKQQFLSTDAVSGCKPTKSIMGCQLQVSCGKPEGN